MKYYKFILIILVIFLKTGNVLSNTNIFNVNNIEINKDIYKSKEKLVNKAFQEGFKKLIKSLLLEDDFFVQVVHPNRETILNDGLIEVEGSTVAAPMADAESDLTKTLPDTSDVRGVVDDTSRGTETEQNRVRTTIHLNPGCVVGIKRDLGLEVIPGGGR